MTEVRGDHLTEFGADGSLYEGQYKLDKSSLVKQTNGTRNSNLFHTIYHQHETEFSSAMFVRHGKGRKFYASGRLYSGEWVNGMEASVAAAADEYIAEVAADAAAQAKHNAIAAAVRAIAAAGRLTPAAKKIAAAARTAAEAAAAAAHVLHVVDCMWDSCDFFWVGVSERELRGKAGCRISSAAALVALKAALAVDSYKRYHGTDEGRYRFGPNRNHCLGRSGSLDDDDCDAAVIMGEPNHAILAARYPLLASRIEFYERPHMQTYEHVAGPTPLLNLRRSKHETSTIAALDDEYNDGARQALEILEGLEVNLKAFSYQESITNPVYEVPMMEQPEGLRRDQHGKYLCSVITRTGTGSFTGTCPKTAQVAHCGRVMCAMHNEKLGDPVGSWLEAMKKEDFGYNCDFGYHPQLMARACSESTQVCAPVYVEIDSSSVVDKRALCKPILNNHPVLPLVDNQPLELVRAVLAEDPRDIELPNSDRVQWNVLYEATLDGPSKCTAPEGECTDAACRGGCSGMPNVPVFWTRKTYELVVAAGGTQDCRVVYMLRL